MQHVTCPGCGAQVDFKSAASVMAVCEYCRTTVLKDAESVRDLGKMSEVIEDYSPLQIGTSGSYQGKSFSLIGRIQLRYAAGFWNEWYALFDSGETGWLSDGSGQYTMTFPTQAPGEPPSFESLRPGQPLTFNGLVFSAADIRTARCTGGQGELPFKVGAGWQARVADFRNAGNFLTLDYSEGATPQVFLGAGVALADLKAQLLREPEAINASAGKFRGKVEALACPSCGASVAVSPGMTSHFVCPSCQSQVDLTGPTAQVLAKGNAVAAVPFSLELGATANLDGTAYTILGALRRAEISGSFAWSEYLLYAPGRPFVWLVESDEGWQRAQVLDVWPLWPHADAALLEGRTFRRTSQYQARVVYAIGAFNWRVAVGDTNQVAEFTDGQTQLAAEADAAELTWSRSRGVPLDQVRAWFGEHVHVTQSPHPSYRSTARFIIIAMLVVNAIPLLLATRAVLFGSIVAALAVYLPAMILDRMEGSST